MPDDPSLFAPGNMKAVMFSFWQLFILGLLFAPGVGVIAKTRGRSFWGWMLLSLIITPIIAGIIVLIMKERPAVQRISRPM
jgi:hypothetical protein